MSAGISVIVLDGVHVSGDDGGPIPLQPHMGAGLFALLALDHVPVRRLRELLYPPGREPKDPKRPVKMMSELRRRLGGDRIVLGPLGYGLRLDQADFCDLRSWRVHMARAAQLSADDPYAAVELYDRAFGDWTGLPEAGTEAMHELCTRLQAEWLRAAEQYAEVRLRVGRHAKVAEVLPDLVRAWPEREHLLELLMLALHRCRRSQEALDWYERRRAEFQRTFGAQPSRDLQDLAAQIRAADPALDARPPELPPADRAVVESGGDVRRLSMARMAMYITQLGQGGYRIARDYHTARDRAAVEYLAALSEPVMTLQEENELFCAHVVRELVLRGVRQFVELGAPAPARFAVHEVAALPRPGVAVRTVYLNYDGALVAYAKGLVEELPEVEFAEGTLRTLLDAPHRVPLIDWSEPVAVLDRHQLNITPLWEDAPGMFAELGELLAPGSHIAVTSATADGMTELVARQLGRIHADLAVQLALRGLAELRRVVPPGFELLEPGIVETRVYAGKAPPTAEPGPFPQFSLVARKPVRGTA